MNRGRLTFAGRLLFSLALLAGLAWVAGDDRLPEVIAKVGFATFVMSAVLNTVGSIVVPAVVTHRFNGRGTVDMGLLGFIAINFTIRFYTMVLPRASATAVRWAKYRARSTGATAAAVVVLEKFVQIAVYSTASVVFVLIEAPTLGAATIWLAAIGGALSLVSVIGLIALFSDRLDGVLSVFGFVTRIRWIGSRIGRIADAVRAYRGERTSSVWALAGWTLIGFGFFVGSALVISHQLELGVPVVALIWMRGLVFLSTLVPITIAGAGVREAGFVGFMSLYDVDSTDALGFALSLLGVQIAIAAVGATIELYAVLRRLRQRPDGTDDEPQPGGVH